MSHALVTLITAAALSVGAPASGPLSPPPRPVLGLQLQPAETVAPAPAPASEPAPPPIETTPIQPTTAPAPAAAPAPAVQPMPAVTQPAPTRPARDGHVLLATGGIMAAVGGASLLLVALPSLAVRNSALRRAERDAALAFSTRKERYERARRADDAMEAGFWIGAPLLVTGLVLVISGAVVRSTARSSRRFAAAPGGVALRF